MSIPEFGGIPLTLLIPAFILALSVIVAIHEYGHYIVGRWTGIKADVFSVGFGPILASRVDRHGTRWQLAAIPFGGFVKFRGDANAASQADGSALTGLSPEEKRATMQGAPIWARMLTVLAGPVFNFISAVLVFAGFLLIEGRAVEEAIIGEVRPLPADIATLQEGDLVLSMDGEAVETAGDILNLSEAQLGRAELAYTVLRDGEEIDVMAAPALLPLIGALTPQSAGIEAGLEVGDLIRRVDGQPVYSFSELPDLVAAGQGAPMMLEIWRAGETLEVTLEPRQSAAPSADGGFEERWLIGIGPDIYFDAITERPGLGEALSYGLDRLWFIITGTVRGISAMVVGEISTCNLQGPVGIAEAAGAAASQGIDDFIWLIAVLSVAIGFFNLLPVPVLDGGHLVFHIYEAATGRVPSERVMNVMMSIGLTLLLSLMLFATFTDFAC